jgi:sugar phosphate isomerase/epimerase
MPDDKKHRFGISSCAYPWAIGVARGPRMKKRLTAIELLEKALALGVERVQIAQNLPLENLPWETMVRIKRYAGENGVMIEVGTRGTGRENIMKFLEIAHFLKSPIMRTTPESIHGNKKGMQKLQKRLREVLPEYEKEGITIVLDNQENYKASDLENLMEKVDHPNLGLCLDLSDALGAMEGPEYVINRLGRWCRNFILKDVAAVRTQTQMGFSVEGRPAGKGQLPLKWALEQLGQAGTEHTTILELWPTWQGDITSTIKLEADWVAESVKFMQQFY